ncbi:DUF3558 domain-containing protein [Prauserella cavernicola]|uniref:DUF3558 domain-containing protein n=1 Tax=Prauserella cavernicola TaxID=2800127 RepID=A0A934V231_9PSEU|nr:DUF3558 domain-containing protein [Prauserella cavernicola]MBK1784616.1 DUF3558 domain-containing protein [Prauserella cavernicola]
MSMRRRAGLGLTVLATAITLGACGSSGGDEGVDAPASPSAAPSSSEQAAPPVGEPLDAAALVSGPCAALSPDDLSKFGFAEGRVEPTAGGENATACVWEYAAESGNRVDLSVVTENENGLSAIYEQRSSNEYFEETEIAGYPAVHTATLDNRTDGGCGLWVGVDEQTTLFVLTNFDYGPEVADPCPVADRVAEATIATLRG